MNQTSAGEQPVIELRHVDKHYGALHVLKDINLKIDRGEVLVVIGPSGSGKSTLCRTINRLETIDSGEILIEGEPLPQEGKELARTRAELGMVFQQFNLFAHKTILDNVTLGPIEVLGLSKGEAEKRAMSLLERVGVAEQAKKVPAQLSGGQQQRVALARALVLEPGVLLFDEPLSNLDAKLRVDMRNEIRRIQQQAGITAIYVTHDQSEAMALSDNIIIMKKGVVDQIGDPHTVYYHPVDEFVADFIGESNFLRGSISKKDGESGLATIEGHEVEVASIGHLSEGDKCVLVLRPESAQLAEEGVLPCKVTLSRFMGNYQNYQVMVGDTLVKITDFNPKNHKIFEVGDEAFVKFGKEDVHVL